MAGQFVKLDPLSLAPTPGLDPIPFRTDSWNMLSADGSLIVNFAWDETAATYHVAGVDIPGWFPIGGFDVGPHLGFVIGEATLYAYDQENGRLLAYDLDSGAERTLDDWPSGLWLWDDLHVAGGQMAALVTASTDSAGPAPDYSVFVYDPTSAVTIEIPVGPIERVDEKTGVFDGDYEIPEWDSPGVAWGDSRLFIVHANDPEVLEVDLQAGEVRHHLIETTSWWDRLLANWIPRAAAKGPSLGTYSSAAVSTDNRYLFVSGNRHFVETLDDGMISERSEHLGLTVIDTQTWETVEAPDLPIQFIRPVTGGAIGVDTTSFQPWINDLYLLSVVETGTLISHGPITVREGECDALSDLGHLICFLYGPEIHVQIIDVESHETVARRAMGSGDVLHPNGVLEDWLPTTEK